MTEVCLSSKVIHIESADIIISKKKKKSETLLQMNYHPRPQALPAFMFKKPRGPGDKANKLLQGIPHYRCSLTHHQSLGCIRQEGQPGISSVRE